MAADVYVVMLGTNDVWHGEPPKTESGLTKIVQALRTTVPGTMVMLVLPPGCKSGRCSAYMFGDVHPAVQRVAKNEDVPLVDPEWTEACYQQDQVHLSPHGAEQVANAVAKLL